MIGYGVAIGIAFLIGAKMVTVHSPASAETSVFSSLFGGWEAMSSQPIPAATSLTPSSCDKFQEVRLTGSEADIVASMRVIAKDKTVNATARRDARYYLSQDTANKFGWERIQFYCNF